MDSKLLPTFITDVVYDIKVFHFMFSDDGKCDAVSFTSSSSDLKHCPTSASLVVADLLVEGQQGNGGSCQKGLHLYSVHGELY